jgi:hypothetical protein
VSRPQVIGKGKQCPSLRKLLPCKNTVKCPTLDCGVSAWSNWAQCSSSCGAQIAHSRLTSRTRAVTTHPARGGKACPVLMMTKDCAPLPCPQDCQLGAWSEWSSCPSTCGDTGDRNRVRSIVTHPLFGGKYCGPSQETVVCIKPPCPVDCQYKFDRCTVCLLSPKKCAKGCKKILVSHAKFGGACADTRKESDFVAVVECGQSSDIRSCYTTAPTPAFSGCIVSEFNSWSQCSGTCGGGGMQFRTRTILRASLAARAPAASTQFASTESEGQENLAHRNFAHCPPLREIRNCTFDNSVIGSILRPPWWRQTECPQDCEVSPWNCGSCSQTCGNLGNATRGCTRNVLQPSNAGGRQCPVLKTTRPCAHNTRVLPCPVDCLVSPFAIKYGSRCTRSCGWGQVVRTRKVIRRSAYGGRPCPELQEVKLCNTRHCPGAGDCIVTKWNNKRWVTEAMPFTIIFLQTPTGVHRAMSALAINDVTDQSLRDQSMEARRVLP